MGDERVRPWHYLAVVALTVVCGWFVLRLHQRPPGLTYMDIAVHEIGHVLFRPFGELTMLVMGSGTQIAFPLLLAVFFLAFRRDLLTGSVLLAWTGEAVGDAATYVADAPRGELSLLGGAGEGDWTRILGPEHLSRMRFADAYARNLRVVAVLLMLTAVGLALHGWWRSTRTADRRVRAVPATAGPPVSGEEMWR